MAKRHIDEKDEVGLWVVIENRNRIQLKAMCLREKYTQLEV